MSPLPHVLALVVTFLFRPEPLALASIETRGATLSVELDRSPLLGEDDRLEIRVETSLRDGRVVTRKVPLAAGLLRYPVPVPAGDHAVLLVDRDGAERVLQSVVVRGGLEPLGRIDSAVTSAFSFGHSSF